MNRFTKQLIIGGIFLALVSGVAWLFYRAVVPAATCTDNRQNGREEGVDCGALACGILCQSPVLPLKVGPVSLLKAGSGYDALAHLENPNPLYGASRVDYVLTVFDGAGAVIATRRGNTYVNPAQPRYLLFPLSSLSAIPAKAELSIDVAAVEWGALTVDAKGDIQFGVRNEAFTPASASISFSASTFNASKFTFDTVDVTVLLFDTRGEVVGANTTVQRTVVAGELRAFTMEWPFPVLGAVRAQTMVTTNVFANDNFIREYGSQERFQGF